MKVVSREVERAGFVLNKETGDYEAMFSTRIGSPLLAELRAAEKAKSRNEYYGREVYDLDSVKVMERKIITTATNWTICTDQGIQSEKEA